MQDTWIVKDNLRSGMFFFFKFEFKKNFLKIQGLKANDVFLYFTIKVGIVYIFILITHMVLITAIYRTLEPRLPFGSL